MELTWEDLSAEEQNEVRVAFEFGQSVMAFEREQTVDGRITSELERLKVALAESSDDTRRSISSWMAFERDPVAELLRAVNDELALNRAGNRKGGPTPHYHYQEALHVLRKVWVTRGGEEPKGPTYANSKPGNQPADGMHADHAAKFFVKALRAIDPNLKADKAAMDKVRTFLLSQP